MKPADSEPRRSRPVARHGDGRPGSRVPHVDGPRRSAETHLPAGSPDGSAQEVASSGLELPPHLVPVIRELLTGAPDTTACRQLGMSPRTFGRRVSELLELLNVSTRFQAGVVLVRRQVEGSAEGRHRQVGADADDRVADRER